MASFTPPASLPKYIAGGLPKQDDETLRETYEYIEQLLVDREPRREEPVTEDVIPDDAEVVEEGSNSTVYHEYRTCSDDTCQCMSGRQNTARTRIERIATATRFEESTLEKLIRMVSKPHRHLQSLRRNCV